MCGPGVPMRVDLLKRFAADAESMSRRSSDPVALAEFWKSTKECFPSLDEETYRANSRAWNVSNAKKALRTVSRQLRHGTGGNVIHNIRMADEVQSRETVGVYVRLFEKVSVTARDHMVVCITSNCIV